MSTHSQEVSQERIDHLYPHISAPWKAGDRLEIGDINDMHLFEERMPDYIDNLVSPIAWQGRPHLGERLRPRKPTLFIGSIGGIILTPLAQPLESLLDSNMVIENIDGGTGPKPKEPNELVKELYIGFNLIATASSNRVGRVSTLESIVVYAPAVFSSRSDLQGFKDYSRTPYGLRRLNTRPSISSPEAFDQLVTASRVTAETVLENSLRHTLSNGITQ